MSPMCDVVCLKVILGSSIETGVIRVQFQVCEPVLSPPKKEQSPSLDTRNTPCQSDQGGVYLSSELCASDF